MAVFLRPEKERSWNLVGYYRLSKEGKNSDSESIENQRKLIHSYVDKHPECRLVAEYSDDGYTGTNYDRPGFCSVLDAIRSGMADGVIVKDLSRLGREYIETGKYLETVFPSMGARFIAINDDIDSEDVRAGDDLIVPIKNIMNESYCRELSKKLRKQFRIQRANGEFVGAFACYGYIKDESDRHRLKIDEAAAEVVRSIFKFRVEGYSVQGIADFLNDGGIPSPSEYKKLHGLRYKSGFAGGTISRWSAMTVRSILTNPVYIGKLVQGKRGTPNYKVKKMRMRAPEDWVTVEFNHDPIVDPLLFAVVQKLMQQDTRTPPGQEIVFPLGGMLYCGDCGRPMCRRTVKRGNNTFSYYVCSSNKRDGSCSSHSFSQERLEKAVLHAMQGQIDVVAELDRLALELGSDKFTEAKARRLEAQILEKENELEQYREYRMKLLEAFHDQLINRDEYNSMHRQYGEQIESTQNLLAELERQRNQLKSNGAEMSWAAQFLQYRNLQELTREAVVSLIDRIVVFEDKRIQIEFSFRDEIDAQTLALAEVQKEVV